MVFIDAMPRLVKLGTQNKNLVLGKAGRKRWLGIRPTVRGVVMNPCDHPHGGGEGRSPIGRAKPVTLWGRPALGIKLEEIISIVTSYHP